MSEVTTEFPFPRFVEEATSHNHFFVRKNLADIGWDGTAIPMDKDHLTAKQERQLFSAMQVAAYLACKYKGKAEPFTKRGQKYYNLYQNLFSFLVQQNIRLIYATVARTNICVPNVEDLETEGYTALFNSVRNFNPWRGFKFSTYACNVIKRDCWKYATAQAKKTDKHLIMAGGEENLTYEVDYVENPGELVNLFLSRAVSLTDREIGVLHERYMTGRVKTLAEIGVEMGISQERVRQIQNQAIYKIQRVVSHTEY